MSFVGKVAAIKDALGLPCDVLGALPIVTAANGNALMGIAPDDCAHYANLRILEP